MPTFLSEPVDCTPGTADQWVDVDLSSSVPSNVAGVIIACAGGGTSYSAELQRVRSKGGTDVYSIAEEWLMQHLVRCTSNGLIQAYVTSTTTGLLWLVGYFENGEAGFPTNAVVLPIDDATGGSWKTMDASEYVGGGAGGGLAALRYWHQQTAAGTWILDLRHPDSTDSATTVEQTYDAEICQFVGLKNGAFEYYLSSDVVNFCYMLLTGWVNEEWIDWNVNKVSVTPGATTGWQDMTALASGDVGAQYFITIGSYEIDCGLRPKGSSGGYTNIPNRVTWLCAAAGTSDTIQGYRDDSGTAFAECGSFLQYDGTDRDPIFFGMNF